MSEIGGTIGKMGQVSAAISAAVEQHSATTREIAGSVQAMSGATAASAEAMRHVVEIADGANSSSTHVLDASDEIGHEASTLRTEVDQFLGAVRGDTGERRQFERIEARGMAWMLRAAGRSGSVTLRNVSRGGAPVACDWTLAAGAPFELELPSMGGRVTGRIVRGGDEGLAVVFGAEAETATCVDRLLATLSPQRQAA
jgi:methyl-accepting chemotaxis protein